jgi:hypothetical protein
MNPLTLHCKTLCVIAMATGMLSAYAAIVDPYSSLTFEQMQAQAKRDGAVPISVLISKGSLFDLTKPNFRTDVEKIANQLYAELGAERWIEGTSDASLSWGMFSAYITLAGLDILKRTNNAISFSITGNWKDYTHLDKNYSNSLDIVEEQLITNGFVDAVLTINVDGLIYDILSDGRLIFKGDAAQIQDFATRATKLLDSLLPEEVLGDTTVVRQAIEKIRTGQAPFDPSITVRLNLKGFIRLSGDSQNLRSMTPKGFINIQERIFDPSLLTNAARDGVTRTEIQIKNHLNAYNLSSASKKQTDAALARAMNDILVKAGLQDVMKLPEFGDIQWKGLIGSANPNFYMPYYGNATGDLTVTQLERLKGLNDDRILSITAPLMATLASGSIDTPAQSSNTSTQPTVIPEKTSGIATAVDTVFNWAEKTQPAVGLGTLGTTVSQTGAGYRFRYYPASNSYLGVNETGVPKIYYIGALSSQKLLDLGYLTDWLPIAASKIIPAVK